MSAIGPVLYIAVLWMAVLLAAVIVATFTETGEFAASDFAAWALNAGLTLLLASLAPVRAFLTRLSPPRAAIIASIFFGVALGAVAPGVPREANFPFITWNMFSKAKFYERPVFAEFTAVRSDGSTFPFNPVPVMLALRHARLTISLENRMAAQTEESVGEFADILEALGKVYNAAHPGAPIASLDVYITKVELGDQAVPERDYAFSLAIEGSASGEESGARGAIGETLE